MLKWCTISVLDTDVYFFFYLYCFIYRDRLEKKNKTIKLKSDAQIKVGFSAIITYAIKVYICIYGALIY